MDSVEQTKACTKCGEVKPLSMFAARKDRGGRPKSECRRCSSDRQRARWHANIEENRARRRDEYPRVAAKQREYGVNYREANRERARETVRKWRDDDPERAAESKRRYRERNRDKVRAMEQLKSIKRRTRMQGSGVYAISAKDMRRLLNSPCAVDGCTNTNMHIDHVIPVSRGGSHGIGNLQALCARHNQQKWSRTWIEFRVYLNQIAA